MDDIRYELVDIETASPALFTDCDSAPRMTMRAELYRPPNDAAAPFPAVVVSEGRGGTKPTRVRPYARHLAEAGYAVLVLDSHAARGYAGRPRHLRTCNVSEATFLADAFAGLAFCLARSDIAPTRIHHLGFSDGGMTAELSAYDQLRAAWHMGENAFASHASFYGLHALRLIDYRTSGAPVAVFYGAQDDTLNYKRLDLVTEDLRNGGSAVQAIGYDAACHEWDREHERPHRSRLNLRALAGRIDPEGVLFGDDTGKPIKTRRARCLWLARAASLYGVRCARHEETTAKARTALLDHLARSEGSAGASGGAIAAQAALGEDRRGGQ